ncbi:MAG: PIN domain-containing protein [Gemmataceae bacterium]|nr:PIN domain-containing protein [Gemmataceae bacterium]
MKEITLLDTGPLVALANPNDHFHDACREQATELDPPLFTTWAVLTEAAWILRKDIVALNRLFELGQEEFFILPALGESCLSRLRALAQKYRNLGAQLADLTLIYLAETLRTETVFTLDRRDFSIYRWGRNRGFRMIP